MAATRTQKEIRQRAPIWLLMLLTVNLVIVAVNSRDDVTTQRRFRSVVQAFASPFQRATSKAGGSSVGFINKIRNFNTASEENERLKQQVSDLQLQVEKARGVVNENEQLRGLLNLKQKTGYEFVSARVIARDPTAWFNSITISEGSSSGIELNMPVVTASGIVGRVVALSPWTAQVMLITDDQAAAGAVVGQLGQSNALGSVRGLGQTGLVEMRYVSGLEKVEVGDNVLTTGQDGIYPAGLNVGSVVEVRNGTATQAHTIYIRPGAQLGQLKELAVLRYHPPQRGTPEQTLPNVDKTKK